MQADIESQARRVDELNLIVEKTTSERAKLQAELAKYTGTVAETRKKIDELETEQRRLQTRLQNIAPSLSKTLLRDAPMTDFMAPTLKVQQVMLPNSSTM